MVKPLRDVFGPLSARTDIVCAAQETDLDRALLALSGMAADLREAKATIPALVGYEVDLDNSIAVKKAKEDFQKSLTVHIIDRDDQASVAILERMYGLYESIFPIEEERERLDKLIKVMGRNHTLAERDMARQHWIVLETPEGEIVGGRYVSTFVIPDRPSSLAGGAVTTTRRMAQEFDGTQHLTYSFIDARYRAMGLGDYTMRIAEQAGREFIASAKPGRAADTIDMVRFCEQNNPLLMPVADFLADTIGAKTDPFWRRNYYQKQGFREIAFDYAQLPLRAREEGGLPCEILMLLTKPLYGPASMRKGNPSPDTMDGDLVKFHVYNTFEHSFAGGQYVVTEDPDWARQADALRGEMTVHPPKDFDNTCKRAWHMIDFARTLSIESMVGVWPLGQIMDMREIPALAPRIP